MKRKITHDTRTAFSESDVKTEVTEDEAPVRKRARTNRQGSSSDTISSALTLVTPFGPPSKYLERNESPSLWITLPRAEKSQLLDFVLEYRLMDVTPERFKVFLTDWLLFAQQQMIQMLRDDVSKDAKREISSFFPGSQRQKTKEAKVYYCHILRFVLKFTFNTLRHVFKWKPQNCYFIYDGKLEEDATVDQNEVKPQISPLRAHVYVPEVLPTVVVPFPTTTTNDSMDYISGISLGSPSIYLERNQYPSLWISLPAANKSQLLEFVLEDELIKGLSKPFKAFLTDWLVSVQQQMIEALKNDVLRKTIEAVKVYQQKYLPRCDKRLRMFLEHILPTVLDTQNFAIFGGQQSPLLDFISCFVKKRNLRNEIDEAVFPSVIVSLNKRARTAISSFFAGSKREKSKEAKTYCYHILRFALKFALNTLRHVFKFEPYNWSFFYDGELEEEWENATVENEIQPQVVAFPTPATYGSTSGTITKNPTTVVSSGAMHLEQFAEERDVKPPVVPFPAPVSYDSSSGSIAKNPTTTASFGSPSMQVAEERDVKPQLPLTVPFAAPVYEPQSNLLPKVVVPTVPPPNVPSSSNASDNEDGTSRRLNSQFVSDKSVPPNWIDMVLQHNAIIKSQEARWEARYQELKAEIQELKDEKRRGLI
ncbi:hypothetical protein B9Z55_000847 [Caenorhabditis nigoni]|uniref:Uncharacterized protein n=1 Tax=Caenorhabditis nigoni TaxID=1611254 RepID=A0A2G5VV45_9PELO|nr:hypothetical protein B9Z55_000847 [Caenorhabditis nigoni]